MIIDNNFYNLLLYVVVKFKQRKVKGVTRIERHVHFGSNRLFHVCSYRVIPDELSELQKHQIDDVLDVGVEPERSCRTAGTLGKR